MKDYIFWLGILATAIVLEYGVISSPFMLHFAATVLVLILFVFKRSLLFVTGTVMLGVFFLLTSITPWSELLSWLGVWTVTTWGIYYVFPKSHVWPVILSIGSFRLFQYLFSEIPIWDILQEPPILIGSGINLIFAAMIAFWFFRVK